jgi:hypothetical protein
MLLPLCLNSPSAQVFSLLTQYGLPKAFLIRKLLALVSLSDELTDHEELTQSTQ